MTDLLDLPADGRFVGPEHRFPLRVYFEDTDVAQVVYYANFLKYMERARSDMLRLAGVDQRAAMESGQGAYVVAEVHIRYRRAAKLDDVLLVLSSVRSVKPASTHIHQRVMRGDVLLCEAEVTAAFVSPGGQAVRQPKDWVARFKDMMAGGVEA